MTVAPGPPRPLLPGSVDAYVVTRVPVCSPRTSARSIREALSVRDLESVADVAVCADDGHGSRRLLGLIPVKRALAADPDVLAGDLMDPDPPVVAPGVNQEHAAWKAAQHGESSLAVVDEQGSFVGLVPPERLLMVLLRAHDQDLAAIGGFVTSTNSARHAMMEPVRARIGHRLPWLLLGLAGSAGAAVLVRGFESALAADVRLAFFLPGIVYMADAVGTQTETLFVRGLSVGVPARRVLRLESLTGLVVGLVLASLTIPAVWLVLGSLSLGLTVGISLVAACAVATVVALVLPLAMSWLGRDPAFGSGPLATVIQDLLSLVIYFAVAGFVVG